MKTRITFLNKLSTKKLAVVSDFLFFAPFGLWASLLFLTLSTSFAAFFGTWTSYTTLRISCLCMLVIREFVFGNWNRRSAIGVIVLSIMLCSAYPGSEPLFVDTACFIFCARDIPLKKLASFSCALLVAFSSVTILASQIGVIPDHVLFSGNRERHHLGFGWPNTGPAFMFFGACSYLVVRGRSIRTLEVVSILLLFIALYISTGCRTTLVVAPLAALLALIAKLIPKKMLQQRFVGLLATGSVAIIAVAAITLSAAYNPDVKWMSSLDSLLSGRLALGHWAIHEYGFGLFGQKISIKAMSSYNLVTGELITRTDAHPVDDLYIRILIQFGLVFTILVVILASWCCYRAWKGGNYALLAVIVCIALYGVSEAICRYLWLNQLLLIFGALFANPNGVDTFAELSFTEEKGTQGKD